MTDSTPPVLLLPRLHVALVGTSGGEVAALREAIARVAAATGQSVSTGETLELVWGSCRWIIHDLPTGAAGIKALLSEDMQYNSIICSPGPPGEADAALDEVLSLLRRLGAPAPILAPATGEEALGDAAVGELLDALEQATPTPRRAASAPLLLSIADVFTIRDRGTVVTGRIERGRLHTHDEVEIVGLQERQERPRRARVAGVEMVRTSCFSARAGDTVGCLLADVAEDEVTPGQVLAAPGSVVGRSRCVAMLQTQVHRGEGPGEGLRSGQVVPLRVRGATIPAILTLAEGRARLAPGEHGEALVELSTTSVLEPGLRLMVREGDQVLLVGAVLEVME